MRCLTMLNAHVRTRIVSRYCTAAATMACERLVAGESDRVGARPEGARAQQPRCRAITATSWPQPPSPTHTHALTRCLSVDARAHTRTCSRARLAARDAHVT